MTGCTEHLYDSRRSWIVCASSFVVQFIIFGVHSSYGMFFIAIQKEFQQRESATAWVGSQAFGLMFFLGPLTTALCEHLGSRIVTCVGGLLSFVGLLTTSFVTDFNLLYFSYGLLWGVGTSFCYFASLVVLPLHFRKYLSLAYGIAIAGAGVGVPPMAWAINEIMGTYGWRITMRVLAGLSLLFCVSSLSYGPIKVQNSHLQCIVLEKGDSPKRSDLGIIQKLKISLLKFLSSTPWRNKAFVVWAISLGLIGFGNFTPFVFLISIANDIGISSSKSALLIGYQAITQTLARITFGRLGDNPRINKVAVLQVIGLLHAVNATLCPLAKSYALLVVYVIVLGLCDGCLAVMFGMGTLQIVGDKLMGSALGNLCCAVAIGNVAGPPVAGFIFDVFGKYDIAFYLSGAIMTCGVCLLFLVPWLLPKKEKSCEEKSVLLKEDNESAEQTTNYKRTSRNLHSFPSDASYLTGFHCDQVVQRSVSMEIVNPSSPLMTSPVYRVLSAAANLYCADSLNGSSGYESDCVGDGSSLQSSRVVDKSTDSQHDSLLEEKPVESAMHKEKCEFVLEEQKPLRRSVIGASLDVFSVVFEKLLENTGSRTSIIESSTTADEYLRCVESTGVNCSDAHEVQTALESCRETTL